MPPPPRPVTRDAFEPLKPRGSTPTPAPKPTPAPAAAPPPPPPKAEPLFAPKPEPKPAAPKPESKPTPAPDPGLVKYNDPRDARGRHTVTTKTKRGTTAHEHTLRTWKGVEWVQPDGTSATVLSEPTVDPEDRDYEPEVRLAWTYPLGSRRAGTITNTRMTLMELAEDIDRFVDMERKRMESIDPKWATTPEEGEARMRAYRTLRQHALDARDRLQREHQEARKKHVMNSALVELVPTDTLGARQTPDKITHWGTPSAFYFERRPGASRTAELAGVRADARIVALRVLPVAGPNQPSESKNVRDHVQVIGQWSDLHDPDLNLIASLENAIREEDALDPDDPTPSQVWSTATASPGARSLLARLKAEAAAREEAEAAAQAAGTADATLPARIRERALTFASTATDRSAGDPETRFRDLLNELVPKDPPPGYVAPNQTASFVAPTAALKAWHAIFRADDSPRDSTNARLTRMTIDDVRHAITAHAALHDDANTRNGVLNLDRDALIAGLKAGIATAATFDYQAAFKGVQIIGLDDHVAFAGTDGFAMSTHRAPATNASSIGNWWLPLPAAKALASAARKVKKGTPVSLDVRTINRGTRTSALFTLHADGEAVFTHEFTGLPGNIEGAKGATVPYPAWWRLGMWDGTDIGSGRAPDDASALGLTAEEKAAAKAKQQHVTGYEYRVNGSGTVTRSEKPELELENRTLAFTDHPRYLGAYNGEYVQRLTKTAGKNATLTRVDDPTLSESGRSFLRITNPEGFTGFVIQLRRDEAKAAKAASPLVDALETLLGRLGITLPDPPPAGLFAPPVGARKVVA